MFYNCIDITTNIIQDDCILILKETETFLWASGTVPAVLTGLVGPVEQWLGAQLKRL